MNSLPAAFVLLVTATAAALAADTTFDFPTYGVSVAVPEGLQRVPDGNPAHVARWAKSGGEGDPEFILAVEASPAAQHDLQTYAQKTAEAVGGAVSNEAVELGGEKAVRAIGSPTGTEMRPLEALIVQREGMFYMLTRTGKKAEDGAAEFAAMKASWKWIPVEPASDYVALLPEPISVFDDLFSFRPPTLVRPYPVGDAKKQLSLGIYNVQTKNQDFFLNIEVVRRKANMSLDQVGELFAQNAAKNFYSKEPISWERRKDGVEYLLSKPFTVEIPNPDGTPTPQAIQFLLFVTKSKWVVFTCAISAKEESARKGYLALIEEVARTIAIPEEKNR